MNALRRGVYTRFKQKGYPLISYISSRATYFPGTPIGDNCFVLEDNTIQPFVKIGNNVVLWSGNHIGHHSTIADDVFLPRTWFSRDIAPSRSRASSASTRRSGMDSSSRRAA